MDTITIDTYCDMAKKMNGLKSDRELGRKIGVPQSVVSAWRTKRAWPGHNTMIRIATLAGMDSEIAIIHLEYWKAQGPAKEIYSNIAHKLNNFRTLSQQA